MKRNGQASLNGARLDALLCRLCYIQIWKKCHQRTLAENESFYLMAVVTVDITYWFATKQDENSLECRPSILELGFWGWVGRSEKR